MKSYWEVEVCTQGQHVHLCITDEAQQSKEVSKLYGKFKVKELNMPEHFIHLCLVVTVFWSSTVVQTDQYWGGKMHAATTTTC